MSTSSPVYAENASRSAFVPNVLDWIALLLVIVGGVNWGLVGAFQFDLVATLFGEMTMLTRAVYGLVGVAALYSVSLLARLPRHH